MVGGPVHGEAWEVPEPPPWVLMVPRKQEWSILDFTDTVMPMPEPHTYNLRRLTPNPRAQWPLDHAYLCMAEPERLQASRTGPDPKTIYYARAAETLWLQAFEEKLPPCVAPTCTDKGRYKFEAAEPGRLAGRWWETGDEIRLCPAHGDDIYRAQGVYGLDELADWLKPDVMLDTLDYITAGTLFVDEMYQQRGRAIRIAHRERP